MTTLQMSISYIVIALLLTAVAMTAPQEPEKIVQAQTTEAVKVSGEGPDLYRYNDSEAVCYFTEQAMVCFQKGR